MSTAHAVLLALIVLLIWSIVITGGNGHDN